jgi:hypothetical protein
MARRKIYKGKFSVNCKAVEEVLKGESRVPSSVNARVPQYYYIKMIDSSHSRMHSQHDWPALASTYTLC